MAFPKYIVELFWQWAPFLAFIAAWLALSILKRKGIARTDKSLGQNVFTLRALILFMVATFCGLAAFHLFGGGIREDTYPATGLMVGVLAVIFFGMRCVAGRRAT